MTRSEMNVFCQEFWNCEGFLVNAWRAGRGSRYKSCRHILLTLVLQIFRPERGGPGGDYGPWGAPDLRNTIVNMLSCNVLTLQ